ncbi:hypothetical protein AX15_002251 [Amanita polypyramis BW_CC]|nr:hypothetical protein AX15_002251 [Amanita polypyramis BW_CC]
MPRSPLTTKLLAVKKTSSTSRLEARLNSAPDQRFSAADRKILEELRRNISAREAQFAAKGRSVSFGRNGVVHGKKHHPYPRREVPYPRNYEREVLDLDVWETAFCHDACGSITWHVFKTPPTRVLDLGCGTGSWILSCAKEWGDCQFVGLDIVPLHPDLRRIGSPDLASRITWVQANFLEKLPFPNEEFDYVHVKRIALGVPEDKWDPLLEEITRIMKPGAAFELIEEDLFFPGKQVNSDSDSESEDEDTTPGTSLNTSSQTIVEDHHSAETQLLVPARTDDNLTPTTVASALPTTPSRPSSPVPIREVVIAETEETDGDGTLRYDESAHQLPSLSSPSTPTATRPSLQVKTSHESWHTGYRPLMPKRSTSALSLPTPKSSISPIANQSKKISESKGPVPNSNTPHVPMPVIPRTHAEDLPHNLPKTSPEPPINPRDHTLLEAIYVRMLESRFINMSPLSLLGNSLGLYFKDLRTHPAIQFTFPPLPPRKYRIFGKVEEHRKLGEPEQVEKKEFTYNEEEVCGCDDDTEVDEKSRFLSMQALLQHESRYVSLDETRPTAFSPSTRVDFTRSTRDMKSAAIRRSSRLPNGQLQLDLKTLNLHLAMRIEEVSACAESMWEWVTEEQRTIANISQEHNRLMATNRSISRPRTSFSSNVSERTIENTPRDKIAYMTRDDFDGLLTNFRFDMHDQYMPGYALRDRFDWAVSLCLPPPDRIAYDSACEKWRNWEMQEREKATAMRSRLPPALARPRAASSSNLSHVSSTVSAPQITRAHSGQSSVSTQSGQSSLSGGSSTLVPPQGERSGDARGGQGHDTSGESLLANTKNGRPCGTSRVCQTPPTKKQSRALKVFVGWKP